MVTKGNDLGEIGLLLTCIPYYFPRCWSVSSNFCYIFMQHFPFDSFLAVDRDEGNAVNLENS